MKTIKEIKKPTYKIIDHNGNTLAKGFRNWRSAKSNLHGLKIHKSEKLEVVEE